jgi:hypothetical protein
MNAELGVEYTELLQRYHDLADGVRMVRRAADKACRVGVLPYEPIGNSPLEECEAIARSIYGATAKQQEIAVRGPSARRSMPKESTP